MKGKPTPEPWLPGLGETGALEFGLHKGLHPLRTGFLSFFSNSAEHFHID